MKSSLIDVCRVTPASKLYVPRTIFHHNYLFITLSIRLSSLTEGMLSCVPLSSFFHIQARDLLNV